VLKNSLGTHFPPNRVLPMEDELVFGHRPLYIELRALRVTVHVQDTPDLGPLDYGLVIDGLNALSDGRRRRLRKRAGRDPGGM
jgi:hypothetical protein